MGFLRLDSEERKKICKYVNFDDFKKSMNKNMKYKAKIKTIIGKSFDKFQYSDMIKYINDHIEEDEAEAVVLDYVNYIKTEFMKDFKELHNYNNQVIEYLKENGRLDERASLEEVNHSYELLDAYKEQYNIEAIDYDLFKRFYVIDSEEELDEYIAGKENERKEEEKQYKLEHLDDLEEKVSELEEELEKKKQDLKTSEEAVSDLSEQLQKYQTALSLDNTRYKLSSILRVNITAMTEKEIYEKLNEEEEKALEKEDYGRVKQLLAAKYFMITAKEVE